MEIVTKGGKNNNIFFFIYFFSIFIYYSNVLCYAITHRHQLHPILVQKKCITDQDFA